MNKNIAGGSAVDQTASIASSKSCSILLIWLNILIKLSIN